MYTAPAVSEQLPGQRWGFGKKALDKFLMLNYRYEVVIGTYVLDTWEKMVVNVLLLIFLVFVVRTALTTISTKIGDLTSSWLIQNIMPQALNYAMGALGLMLKNETFYPAVYTAVESLRANNHLPNQQALDESILSSLLVTISSQNVPHRAAVFATRMMSMVEVGADISSATLTGYDSLAASYISDLKNPAVSTQFASIVDKYLGFIEQKQTVIPYKPDQDDFTFKLPVPTASAGTMVFKSLKKLNYQYEVTTGLYMLESWEKYIVNGVVCAGFALIAYTAINHLPVQSTGLFRQLSSFIA
ncbi:hypothetical protein EV174_002463 [Coemansia sp. RSA 2320]|nr:hypothetical protein EV174_002463 [Coemansia sp. RSA 2320]